MFPFLLKIESTCLIFVLCVALRWFPRQKDNIILIFTLPFENKSPYHPIQNVGILQQGSANISCRGPDSKYCITITQFSHCHAKEVTGNMEANEQGYIPVKLCLWTTQQKCPNGTFGARSLKSCSSCPVVWTLSLYVSTLSPELPCQRLQDSRRAITDKDTQGAPPNCHQHPMFL